MKKRNLLIITSALICSTFILSACSKDEEKEKATTKTTNAVAEEETTKALDILMPKSAYNMDAKIAVHDPSIFKDNGKYYIFGSHLAQASSGDLLGAWTPLGVQGYSNSTLYGGALATSLAEPFKWAGGKGDADHQSDYGVWAPDIIYNKDYIWEDGSKGAYMLYSCTSATYIRSAIIFSVSKNAEGPFTYKETLIQSGFTKDDQMDKNSTINKNIKNTNWQDAAGADVSSAPAIYFSGNNYNSQSMPNAIDPNIFFDKDGQMWMSYGSWSGGLYILKLDKTTGKVIHDYQNQAGDVFTDKYFGKRIAGGSGASLEAPYILFNKENGYYYLFVSYGWLAKDGGYNIRVFRSTSPDGPYTDPQGLEATKLNGTGAASNILLGLKLMGGYNFPSLNTGYVSPGHNSAFIDEDGKMYVVYHTRFESTSLGEAHQPRVHQLFLNADGWPSAAPFQYSGETLGEKTLKMADVIGNYSVVTHLRVNNKVPEQAKNIKLNKDGTISGELTGTFTFKDGETAITIKEGKNTYIGNLCNMTDEAGNKCLIFTAVSDTAQSLWGVKYIK